MINRELSAILQRQNAALPASSAREQNLTRLGGGAQAFITGQQAGLYGGPLLTLAKAASAVKHAATSSGVPIFWVQAEDHDFPEIHQAILPASGKEKEVLAIAASIPESDRISVHEQRLGDEITALNARFAEHFARDEQATVFLELLRQAYLPGTRITDAFAALIGGIFREQGLIVFNPRDRESSRLLAPFYKKIWEHRERIDRLLLDHTEQLKQQGREAQVTVRAGSPLFFIHPESPESARYRIIKGTGGWNLIGGSGSVKDHDIERWLEEAPERFSTSALLRPLAQDFMFPTAAYIGGPAELAYHEQIDPLYELLEIRKPSRVARGSFVVIDERMRRLTTQLGLSSPDLVRSRNEIRSLVRDAHSTGSTHPFDSAESELQSALGKIYEALQTTEPTLVAAFSKNRDKFLEQMTGLRGRFDEARERKDGVTSTRLETLLDLLWPDEIPQERVYNGLYFLARSGGTLISKMIASVTPDDRRQSPIEIEI